MLNDGTMVLSAPCSVTSPLLARSASETTSIGVGESLTMRPPKRVPVTTTISNVSPDGPASPGVWATASTPQPIDTDASRQCASLEREILEKLPLSPLDCFPMHTPRFGPVEY